MDLIFIRHAESTNNRNWELNRDESDRVPDPGLTDLGRAQAEALAEWFPGFAPRPTHIFVSPFMRTLLTAVPLVDRLDVTAEVRPDLMERSGPFVGPIMDHVAHPGSPRSVLEAVSPRFLLPESITEEGWWQGPFETRDRAIDRARALAEWLRTAFEPEDCVVLISHGAIGSLLATAMFCPGELRRDSSQIRGETTSWFALDNTSVSWLRTHPGGDTEMRAFNRVDHLVHAGLHSATMAQPS
ncbi:histidine phosphatase family protein [Arachnia propionica]|uniref:Histidine phosphatase family protein n=1 Tax=Arachnia propionica TaxID=1750 RepID=A0A3P1WWI7_9ACTN|nr:histidine phosphatase family protein [Arachnia propionica]RRD50601.1 histidine phosphatase family protein [Arachnia propionica]